jgi:hypothetical protein
LKECQGKNWDKDLYDFIDESDLKYWMQGICPKQSLGKKSLPKWAPFFPCPPNLEAHSLLSMLALRPLWLSFLIAKTPFA